MSETTAFHYVVKVAFSDHRVGDRLSVSDGETALGQGREHQVMRVAGLMPGADSALVEEK